MNRLKILVFLLICGQAYSQNITQAEYYFGTDPGEGNGTAISITPSDNIVDQSVTINTSALPNGAHTLNLRTLDENGTWSHTHKQQILVSPLPSSDDIVAAEYFFDTDPGLGAGTPISISSNPDIVDFNLVVSASGLSLGTHSLSIRAKDSNGIWSHTYHSTFFLTNENTDLDITYIEYYWDTDPGYGMGNNISITPSSDISNKVQTIQTNALDIGVHTLFVRSKDSNETWSHENATIVYITEPQTEIDIEKMEYYWDSDPGYGMGTNISITPSSDISNKAQTIQTNAIANGVHTLYLRSKDTNGKWSLNNSTVVFVTDAQTELDIVKIEYYWDSDPGYGMGTNISITNASDIGNKVTTLSTSGLSIGAHQLNIRSMDSNGTWSLNNTKNIIKLPDNTIEDIVKLEYFWDTDPGYGLGTNISITPNTNIANISRSINASGLSKGVHHLHVRAQAVSGKWSTNQIFPIYRAENISIKDVTHLEYFWNNDPGEGNGESIMVNGFAASDNVGDLSHTFDISNLENGVNILSLRSKDETGQWSHTNQEHIYVYKNTIGDIVSAEYFFNIDPGYGSGMTIDVDTLNDIGNKALNIDVSSLDLGFHKLHVRYLTENGKWTQDEITPLYYKDGQLYTIAEGEYFIDVDPGHGNGTPFSFSPTTDGADLNVLIFTSSIDAGEHDLYIRTKDADGKWSLTNVKFEIDFDSALPLNLLSFDVKKRGESAELIWTATQAMNTSHFEILKNRKGDFYSIGNVESKNQLSEVSYSFIDDNVDEKWNYYKLKQVDQDGAFTYSEIKSVYFDRKLELVVFPNPTAHSLRISDSQSIYSYKLYNTALQNVMQGKFDGSTNLDISQLEDGSYHLILEDEKGQVHQFWIVKI